MISSPILSQIHTVPSEIVLWMVIGLLTLLGVAVALITIWSNVRQRPPHETPTRREFEDLKGKVSQIEASLPPMERRILAAVEGMGAKMEARLEDLARTNHEERVAIWEKFNTENKATGERISRLEARQKS